MYRKERDHETLKELLKAHYGWSYQAAKKTKLERKFHMQRQQYIEQIP